MRSLAIAALLTAAVPAAATADTSYRPLHAPGDAVPGDLVASFSAEDHLMFARQLVPDAGSTSLAQSRIIYLNRTGITVTVGVNDSRTNRSSLVDRPRTVPPWNTTSATWNATVACITDLFSRFAVQVTDRDPGNTPHMEAVFGGAPQDLGMPSSVGGVSPFSASCGVIESSIVFAFTSVLSTSPQRICEVMAQEIAHSYGLDHELLASDPMTYLSYQGNRAFQDRLVPCGETVARPCGLGATPCRSQQNSVALLRERAGTPDAVPPALTITAPADRATVAPEFTVSALATDNLGVQSATIRIDDEVAGVVTGPGPFTFSTPASVAAGAHAVSVEVSDGINVTARTIQVTMIRDEHDGGDDGDGGPLGLGLGCSVGGAAGLGVGIGFAALLARRRRR